MIQSYIYDRDRYFIVNDPWDDRESLFYFRHNRSRKEVTIVFGRGCNGRGLVLRANWFW